jgi:hypothetical protein
MTVIRLNGEKMRHSYSFQQSHTQAFCLFGLYKWLFLSRTALLYKRSDKFSIFKLVVHFAVLKQNRDVLSKRLTLIRINYNIISVRTKT